MEYLGIKRVTVSNIKRKSKKSGDVKNYKCSGVMNFPESTPGEHYLIRYNSDEIQLIKNEQSGNPVRKSGKQTVITIGSFIAKSENYKFFRTEYGYMLKKSKLDVHGVGHKDLMFREKTYKDGHNFIYLNISKVLLEEITGGDILKVSQEFYPYYVMSIEKVSEQSEKIKDNKKAVKYLKYDGNTKTITADVGIFKYTTLNIYSVLSADVKDNKIIIQEK